MPESKASVVQVAFVGRDGCVVTANFNFTACNQMPEQTCFLFSLMRGKTTHAIVRSRPGSAECAAGTWQQGDWSYHTGDNFYARSE